MCLYTEYMINKKYLPNKKNGGKPPVCKDMRTYYVPVKCGKCLECKQQKQREWVVRLSEEIRNNNDCLFVTLTFDEKNLKSFQCSDENETATLAVRLFLERIRKKTGKSVKHWLITELGEENGRIHLHGLIWTNADLIKEKWQYGNVFIGTFVNERTIFYITKYMLKEQKIKPNFEGKILCSSGIGKSYLNRADAKRNTFKEENTDETYRLRNGQKINLPTYYKNKLYNEEQKDKLWIAKQEKGYRYIMGERVSTENETTYMNLLRFYQEKGKRIHGDNPEKWDKEKHLKRLKKLQAYRKKNKL